MDAHSLLHTRIQIVNYEEDQIITENGSDSNLALALILFGAVKVYQVYLNFLIFYFTLIFFRILQTYKMMQIQMIQTGVRIFIRKSLLEVFNY